MHVKIVRVNDDAMVPRQATEGAAGFDLYSTDDIRLGCGDTKLCKTGIKIELPSWTEGQVRSRSGLAKIGVVVANSPGTIDCDFRGEVGILLHNQGRAPHIIRKGDRIAQLVITDLPQVTFEEVDTLSDSDRGSGGFGSTGS